jgi:hemolysin III
MSHRDTTGQVGDALDRTLGTALEHAASHVPDAVKPKLRGWLHVAATPIAFGCGIVLLALSTGAAEIVASTVYAVTTTALFAVSAAYHRGQWAPRTHGVLKRVDHANIYLIIAGTYTPFTVVLLDGGAQTALLWLVWTLALIGVVFRVLWVGAPRWLYVPAYVALGWVAVVFLPEFAVAGGIAVIVLVLLGGLLYTLGGLVYALRRPDPHPGWFGFHEVFHALTLLAYVLHYVAVMITVVAH